MLEVGQGYTAAWRRSESTGPHARLWEPLVDRALKQRIKSRAALTWRRRFIYFPQLHTKAVPNLRNSSRLNMEYQSHAELRLRNVATTAMKPHSPSRITSSLTLDGAASAEIKTKTATATEPILWALDKSTKYKMMIGMRSKASQRPMDIILNIMSMWSALKKWAVFLAVILNGH